MYLQVLKCRVGRVGNCPPGFGKVEGADGHQWRAPLLFASFRQPVTPLYQNMKGHCRFTCQFKIQKELTILNPDCFCDNPTAIIVQKFNKYLVKLQLGIDFTPWWTLSSQMSANAHNRAADVISCNIRNFGQGWYFIQFSIGIKHQGAHEYLCSMAFLVQMKIVHELQIIH